MDSQQIAPLARCPVCNWPMAACTKEGCVPGNCSMRPAAPVAVTPEPTQLYAVESGEYSSHRVDAIFSTRELAQGWIDKHSEDRAEFSINDEWKVDAEVSAQEITVFQCWVNLDSGEIVNPVQHWIEVTIPFRGRVVERYGSMWFSESRCYGPSARVQSGISEDHCLKLAVEERQAWLRERSVKACEK